MIIDEHTRTVINRYYLSQETRVFDHFHIPTRSLSDKSSQGLFRFSDFLRIIIILFVPVIGCPLSMILR